MIETIGRDQADELLKRYPAGYVLFGVDRSICKTESVIPHNSRISEEYAFNWKSVRVSNLTQTVVTIEMPDILYKPLNTQIIGNAFGLARRPMGKQHMFPVKPQGSTHRIFVELLEDNDQQFVFLIGFRGG
jgi:hypothetical protein